MTSSSQDRGAPAGDGPPRLPDGIDPLGVPHGDAGRNAFILTVAVTVALLALVATLGWVVFHRLTPTDGAPAPTTDSVSFQEDPVPTLPTAS